MLYPSFFEEVRQLLRVVLTNRTTTHIIIVKSRRGIIRTMWIRNKSTMSSTIILPTI
ncbi:unnamed protein product [Schistosoma mattheei]|uniref:Uncharacterized protein n=1 Tax=Schistosoma mattheei TaxID=31246 RepID=A0A183PLT8_9TREM|nr:unnamed protein product [Schistosoma mattheei]